MWGASVRSSTGRFPDADSSIPTRGSAPGSRPRRRESSSPPGFTSFLQVRHTYVTSFAMPLDRVQPIKGSKGEASRVEPLSQFEMRKRSDSMNRKWWLVLAASGVLALTAAACGSSDDSSSSGASGDLAGAGSSAQQAAQEAWTAKFEDQNADATISYDPIGSGGGRDQFIAGGKTAFAGSDSPFDTDELPKATDRCTKDGGGQLIQIPNYISPIAIVYNLDGVENLQLSPDVTAKIFKGEITSWDDPAIKADNPGASLPSTDITPVHRSDESGTTANFTDYLHEAAPDVWTDDPDSSWPPRAARPVRRRRE